MMKIACRKVLRKQGHAWIGNMWNGIKEHSKWTINQIVRQMPSLVNRRSEILKEEAKVSQEFCLSLSFSLVLYLLNEDKEIYSLMMRVQRWESGEWEEVRWGKRGEFQEWNDVEKIFIKFCKIETFYWCDNKCSQKNLREFPRGEWKVFNCSVS